MYGDSNLNLVTRGVDAALGGWALQVMALILVLFTFTSVVGNYYYGEASVKYLLDRPFMVHGLRIIVVGLVFLGSIASLDTVWSFADVTMGLMATVNLIAVLALTGVVVKVLRDYDRQRGEGPRPGVHPRCGARFERLAGVGVRDRRGAAGAGLRKVTTVVHAACASIGSPA